MHAFRCSGQGRRRSCSGGGSVLGNIASAFAEGWVWSTSWAMANRAMDAVLGPRTFRIEHAAATTSAIASGGGDDGASSPSNPCQIHAMAFQDVCDASIDLVYYLLICVFLFFVFTFSRTYTSEC